jgi:hypothetical protein
MHPLTAGSIQTKLLINKPGDKYEHEANRIAEQVMRIPEPRQQSSSDGIRIDSRNEKRALFPVLLTSSVHVQRDEIEEIEMEGTDVNPKGLLAPKQVKRVSGRWANLWRSKKDSTIRMLLDNMLKILNAELSGLRVAPVIFDPTPSTTDGLFLQEDWKMQINLEIDLGRKVSLDDKASTLSADELVDLGETLYHEARHAEQTFLVARKRATTIRIQMSSPRLSASLFPLQTQQSVLCVQDPKMRVMKGSRSGWRLNHRAGTSRICDGMSPRRSGRKTSWSRLSPASHVLWTNSVRRQSLSIKRSTT